MAADKRETIELVKARFPRFRDAVRAWNCPCGCGVAFVYIQTQLFLWITKGDRDRGGRIIGLSMRRPRDLEQLLMSLEEQGADDEMREAFDLQFRPLLPTAGEA